jgi:ferritin-like metal-binding protein YciE
LYDAEHQITKALPKMVEQATSPDLRDAFQEHLDQTRHQIERLDQVFERLNIDGERRECKGMEGVLAEGDRMMKLSNGDASVGDAALIAEAQKVEHYEIAGYGTVISFAEQMGHDATARLLQQTLNEEKEADRLLTGSPRATSTRRHKRSHVALRRFGAQSGDLSIPPERTLHGQNRARRHPSCGWRLLLYAAVGPGDPAGGRTGLLTQKHGQLRGVFLDVAHGVQE